MKKYMTSILSLLLFLTGCGGYQPPQAPAETTEETTVSSEPSETADDQKATENTETDTDNMIELPNTGFAVEYTDEIVNAKGMFAEPDDGGEIEYGCGIVVGALNYLLRDQEERDEFDAFMNSIGERDMTEEEDEKYTTYYSPTLPVAQIMGINGGRGFDEIAAELLKDRDGMVRDHIELGNKDGFTYYLALLDVNYPSLQEHVSSAKPEMVEDFVNMQNMFAEHPEWFHLITRQSSFVPPEIGSQVTFETTDLDGNPVSSADVFSQHTVTAINVWKTWCGNCTAEFPELNEMLANYADQGAGLVTYCADARDADKTAEAREIVSEYAFSQNLAWSESIEQAFPVDGTPFTYFVDSDGKMLTYPIVGKDPERVEEYLKKLLNGETIEYYIDKPQAGSELTYSVHVVDQNGDPVKGAVVSFCSDTSCNVAETNDSGIASYTGPAFHYHVQFISLPDGYSKNKEDAGGIMDDDASTMTVEVTKN